MVSLCFPSEIITSQATIDEVKKKRHIAGGILLSVSLLFGGLAIIVLSLKNEEKYNEHQIE